MMKFKVTGNDRANHTTGHGEAFEIEVEADSAEKAERIAYRQRQRAGRFHILIGAAQVA